jgi:anti-sigma-K factor RskA
MNIRDNPGLAEKLAAEYVLGTLKGGARRRFEHWLAFDAGLGRAVAEWQSILHPLSELGAPVAPPARLWRNIEHRLGHAAGAADPAWWQFWRGAGARVWGGLAVAASAAAVVLALQLAGRGGAPLPQEIATLTDAEARPALVVVTDQARGRIEVRVAEGVRVPDDRTLQLWAITKAGTPRSLGILPDNRSATLALDARAIGPDVMLLAVSQEPKGGSPNPDAPTGPVLYKGSWVRL